MGKFISILFWVAFGVVILGISIIQVRGLKPGQPDVDGDLVNPNSELSLYLADPGYFGHVLSERIREIFTFEPATHARYRLSLSQERFDLSKKLLSENRTWLGLWTWRKALIYQSEGLDLFSKISDSQTKIELAESMASQLKTYRQELTFWLPKLSGNELSELGVLQRMLTDNTQRLQEFLNQLNQ